MTLIALPPKIMQGAISANGGFVVAGNSKSNTVGVQIANQVIAQPVAPTVNNAGTGGLIAAGTYQVKVTLVNRFGESQVSSSTSTTTSGSTSTITVTAPTIDSNATGWNIYMTQAGGSTYTLQNATPLSLWQQPTYTFPFPPTSTGANPPAAPAWSGTLAFNASLDRDNWVALPLTPTPGGAAGQLTTTANGIFTGSILGLAFLQVIATAWTSGQAIVTIVMD